MRAFIAFPVSDEVKRELVKKQVEIKDLNITVNIKWVEDFNIHVTVEFLEDISEIQSEYVKNILNKISVQYKPFQYELDKINGFPHINHPSVLVVGIHDDKNNQSANLHNELHRELAKFGLNLDNKPWNPHVTLGRIKTDFPGPINLNNISVQNLKWIVNEILFIKSELTSSGPKYEILKSFKII